METTKKTKKHNFILAACFCCLVLMTMLGCGNSVTTTEYTAAPGITDYALKTNWQTLPTTASQAVDVFFVYPTTYFPNPAPNGPTYTAGWNQTIEQATADLGITNQVASKTSIFYKAGTNLYVPYYRQAAGINLLQALCGGLLQLTFRRQIRHWKLHIRMSAMHSPTFFTITTKTPQVNRDHLFLLAIARVPICC